MAAHLKELWTWTPEWAGGAVTALARCGRLLVALDRNACVAGVDLAGTRPRTVWRHPDPLGRSLNIRWAVGGTRGPLFVSIRTGESSHALRRLDPGTGKVLWEDEVRTGPVEDLATDRRKLYAGQRDDDQYWIHGFPTRRGDYKWQLELSRAARDATFPMAASLAAGGGVFYADGAVVYRSEAELGRQWLVARIPEGQHTAPRVAALVAASGDRLFATDTDGGVSRLIAVGRRRRVQWRTPLPGAPALGRPLFDAKLRALLVTASDGRAFCLDDETGAVRWATEPAPKRPDGRPGPPAIVRNRLGTFVAYADEAGLVLVNARTGATLHRLDLPRPRGAAVQPLADGSMLLLPRGVVTAFEVVG
jgi:outer membrane protein assembly factor BamB